MLDTSQQSTPIDFMDAADAQSLAQFQHNILDHLPMMIYVSEVISNTDARMIFANRAARALGKTFLNKPYHEFMPAEEAARAYKSLNASLEANAPITFEASYTAGHGLIWTLATNIPMPHAEGRGRYVLSVVQDITAQKQREQEEHQRHLEIIEQQAQTLAEVSTPLLAISDTTVVMPLVGAIDTRRVQQIMETLLSGVATSRARIVILDITGVPVVDTQVANALIQASQAVNLLGAEAILTGMRPEVAQTLVQLGVSLQGVISRGTLQDGIAYALHQFQ